MKKIVRITVKIFLSLSVLIIISLASIFIYHRYQLSAESKLIDGKGSVIDMGNKQLNVYSEGDGNNTYVFMSGSGIAAPVYELKGLYSKFAHENKIAVVDRAGYGYSDVFNDDRDIDTILAQTRESLMKSGNPPPYILVPHSISGLEAIYWAQKYPNEIKAIIALDVGLPPGYVAYNMPMMESITIQAMNLLTKLGGHRLFPDIVYDPEVIAQTFLTDDEKEIVKAISYKQVFNNDMKREILQVFDNAKKSTALPVPKETPILFLSAYTDEDEHTEFIIDKYNSYVEYAAQLSVSEVRKVKGEHSIYLYAPEEIYQLAISFIQEQVE